MPVVQRVKFVDPLGYRGTIVDDRRGARTTDSVVADDGPVPSVGSLPLAKPDDPRSGQQPATAGFTCDFKYDSRSQSWRGTDRSGRRYRLRVRDNGGERTYRVSPDEDLASGASRQRAGDDALDTDLTAAHDEARHAAGLARFAERISEFWAARKQAS